MRNQGQVLTRTQIMEHVWNYDYYAGSNVVDVYIRYLRKKIDEGRRRGPSTPEGRQVRSADPDNHTQPFYPKALRLNPYNILA